MNILVYTSIYPIKGTQSGFTPVVRYFCEEWVKQGHNVLVVVSTTRFPLIYYYLPRFIRRFIENFVGFNLPNIFLRKQIFVEEGGVQIIQHPIKKNVPGAIISEKQILQNFRYLSEKYIVDFRPDVAVGHWLSPQIQYLKLTKQRFNIPTVLTLHNKPLEDNSKNLLKTNLDYIDKIGCRSRNILDYTNKYVNINQKQQFLCYSGVIDYYNLANKEYVPKKIDRNNIKICFVGNLIKRKYPEKIIEALNEINDASFEVHYIGEGGMKSKIMKKTLNDNISVTFHGRLDREQVYKCLEDMHFLVMISKDEAFGLVYLEAMLNRTIPIASFDEGFDGIIENGNNGFLCTAGDYIGLKNIFINIQNMPEEELMNIQYNSYKTAINMTDEKMAKEYLNNIIQ
jgi:glycosyltransferase involved in cell wall biosynthesis